MDNSSAAVTTPLWTDSWNDTTTVGRPVHTTEKYYKDYTIFTIALLIMSYVPPFILLPGFFGNIMTIVIMRQMKSGDSAISIYFTVLAAFDLMYLFVTLMWDWISFAFHFRLGGTHTVVCKIMTWLYTGGSTMSAWFLVCMTVHRSLSVVWPHRVNVLCTLQRVRLMILGIIVFFAFLYSHYLFGAQRACYPRTYQCVCEIRNDNKIYSYFLVHIYVYIEMTVYSLLPFIIMAMSNTVLIWKLSQSVKAAGRVLSQGDAEQVQAREKAARSVTVTVIVVSMTFLVLTFPATMEFIFNFFQASVYGASGYDRALSFYIGMTCNIISDINSAINFYLYCLTGRRFREEFIKIMCCGRNRRRRGAHQ